MLNLHGGVLLPILVIRTESSCPCSLAPNSKVEQLTSRDTIILIITPIYNNDPPLPFLVLQPMNPVFPKRSQSAIDGGKEDQEDAGSGVLAGC